MFSPVSLEAQKLISVSIGKINASRVTRTGTSLHKSLLVASVLQRARNVYLDEERERAMRYPYCPPSPPEVTVTPISTLTTSGSNNLIECDKENRLKCYEDSVDTPDRVGEESRLPLAEANTGNNVTHTTTTTTTVTSISNTSTSTTTSNSIGRKRRRVSDQETAAAVSSILPKRLRSELKEDNLRQHEFSTSNESLSNLESAQNLSYSVSEEENSSKSSPADESSKSTSAAEDSNTPTEEESEDQSNTTLEDSDSEGDESISDISTNSSGDEMEVEKLSSLVSYFSFSKSQKQSEFCLNNIHQSQSSQILALTA